MIECSSTALLSCTVKSDASDEAWLYVATLFSIFLIRRGSTLGQVAIAPKPCPCPPNISAYRCKNEHSVAFKICQNAFPAKAPPQTPLGSSRRSPRPPSQLQRGHPSPYQPCLDSPAFSACHSVPPLWRQCPPNNFLSNHACF